MLEVKGNIWDYYTQGNWIVITTNCNTNSKGENIMGKGIALEAKKRNSLAPYIIGKYLKELGNVPIILGNKMISFPTKYNWWEKSDLGLIKNSAEHLVYIWTNSIDLVYMPRLGCQNGKLNWGNVKPILEKYLDDRFIVVSLGE